MRPVRLLRRVVALAALVPATLAATALLAAAPTHEPRASEPGAEPGSGRTAAVAEVGEYVALGDSFTSGPLVPQTLAAFGCFRSTRNYPALLAEALDVRRFTDVSCAGADTTDMRSPQPTGFAAVPPQLSALSARTDLVTLGIGGNDFGLFGRLAQTCPQLRASDPGGAPCRRYLAASAGPAPLEVLDRIGVRTGAVLGAVRRRAPEAQILVVGYPRITPARGTCTVLPFAAGDYAYLDLVQRRLNAALRHAARSAGAGFVDTYRASRGHDACAGSRAWVNGSRTDTSRAQSYHPFGSYMQAVADLVQRRVGS
jgi:lysophospholipase L1-like esterase